MAKSTHTRPIEWGSKARKWEVRDRGLNNQDRRLAIAEQMDPDAGEDCDSTMCVCGLCNQEASWMSGPGWEQARFWAGWRD